MARRGQHSVMAAAALTPDMRRFLVARIHSVPMLEALLLVRSPTEKWTAATLAARLYLPTPRVQSLVEELCKEGLARVNGEEVRYAPSSEEVDVMVEQIANVYSRHVVILTELIHSGVERQAHDFADAFRLRRDE